MHQSVDYLRLWNSRQQFLQEKYMHTITLNLIKIANSPYIDRIVDTNKRHNYTHGIAKGNKRERC